MPILSTEALVHLLTKKSFSLILASFTPEQSMSVQRRVDNVEVMLSSYQTWLAQDIAEDSAYLQRTAIDFVRLLQSLTTATTPNPIQAWRDVMLGTMQHPGGLIGLLRPFGSPTLCQQAATKATTALTTFLSIYDPQQTLHQFFAVHQSKLISISGMLLDCRDAEIINAASFSETQTQVANSQGELSTLPPAVIAERICLYLIVALRNTSHPDLFKYDYGPLADVGNPFERTPVFFEVRDRETEQPTLHISLKFDSPNNQATIRNIAKYIAQYVRKIDYADDEIKPTLAYDSRYHRYLELQHLDEKLRLALKKDFLIAINAMQEMRHDEDGDAEEQFIPAPSSLGNHWAGLYHPSIRSEQHDSMEDTTAKSHLPSH